MRQAQSAAMAWIIGQLRGGKVGMSLPTLKKLTGQLPANAKKVGKRAFRDADLLHLLN
jgi:hypothetical protein